MHLLILTLSIISMEKTKLVSTGGSGEGFINISIENFEAKQPFNANISKKQEKTKTKQKGIVLKKVIKKTLVKKEVKASKKAPLKKVPSKPLKQEKTTPKKVASNNINNKENLKEKQSKTNDNKVLGKVVEKGSGKGNGKGNGIGNGIGDGVSLNKKLDEIQVKIIQNWFPPQKYAARADLVVEVEIFINPEGEIYKYNVLNSSQAEDFKEIEESVIRVLNDPRKGKMPYHKDLNNIVLRFCPRDAL